MRRLPPLVLIAVFATGCASQDEFNRLAIDVSPLPQSVDQLHGSVAQLQGSAAQMQDNAARWQGTVTQLQGNVAQLQATVTQLQSDLAKLQSAVDTATSGTAKIDLQGDVDDHAGSGNQQPRQLYVVPANKYAEVRVISLERSDPKLNYELQLGTSGYYAYGAIIHNVNQPSPMPIAGIKITSYGTPIVLDAGQKILCQIVNNETLKWKLTYHILIYEHALTGAL